MNRTFFTALMSVATVAAAQVPPVCDQQRTLDKYQLLRRLSMDLRGRAPSLAEYEALDVLPDVPAATVASYLQTADYRRTMRAYHEALFWPNVSNVDLNNKNALIEQKKISVGGQGVFVSMIPASSRRTKYRGSPDVQTASWGKDCGTYEQTHFDAAFPGQFRPDPAFIKTEVQGNKTIKQEGWRMVSPYWDPTHPIKVCAFDAQETATTTLQGRSVSCNDWEATGKVECGCGPNLRYCFGPPKDVASVITASLREQLARKVDEVTTGGHPYTDLLLSTTADQNGPIAYWKRYLSRNFSLNNLYAVADEGEQIAPLDFLDVGTWQTMNRGGLHAGVVTMPAYLMRFQSNRGRANRFRTDFECESFVPPQTIETPADGCADSGGDLTGRCTCRYCHRMLEPMAAHWGQFSDSGTTFFNLTQFPRNRSNCVGNNNDPFCRRFYVNDAAADNPGALNAYQYADANHPEAVAALAGGPQKRANEIIASSVFARCTVKRIFATYVKRDIRATGTEQDEKGTLDSLTADFKTHNYDLNWLVTQVVSLPQYRSLR